MIISSSSAAAAAAAAAIETSTLPTAAAIFVRRPCGAGQLPAAVRFVDRRQAYGLRKLKRIGSQGGRRGRCVYSAELVHDAPFAFAIGACVLTSLVAPIRSSVGEDEDGGGGMDSTDARLAVMAIIGFIPYFNWLSWVFAWLDTSKQRYLVYSIVYLAPYLRTKLSLSLEESWLPFASILICILHIQKQASATEILTALLSLMRHRSYYPPSLGRKILLLRVMRNHQREEARRHETGFENGVLPEIKLMNCT